MTMKTIMVSVDGSDESLKRIEVGRMLAERWDGKLVAVAFALAEIPMVFADAFSASMFDAASVAARDQAEDAKAAAEKALVGARCDVEVRLASGVSPAAVDLAAQESLYADLCILPTPSAVAKDDTSAAALLEGALFAGAAPVLAVPGGAYQPADIGKRIAVAWDARREAARAARAAAPFLTEAEAVDALTVVHFWGSEPYGPIPGLAFSEWLSRHGVNVELRELADADVAGAILEETKLRERDLLVMGAYGHSRLRQALMGGVTDKILKETAIPLLLGH
ncbi:MAG: universal stress protein [Neomegalonema sp.]|nr:universal stress protein [Neomegalonema sp.]